jgi:hypothetical protein
VQWRFALAAAVAITTLTTTHAHAEPARKTRAKNPALIAGGVGTILFGLAAGGGGALLTAWATTTHACSDRGCDAPPLALLFPAIALDALALTGIGGGIAMISIGARRVPADVAVVGPACTVTSECGGDAHCIDGLCRRVGVTETKLGARHRSPWFGDGRGYVPAAIIVDLCAFLTTIPPWMIAYAADFSRFMTGFQILPLAVQLAAGPALHLFEGRIAPAAISLLGWSTVAMTTYFVPTIVSTYGDQPNGLAAGTAMLVSGGIAMTIVDAFMARPVPKRAIDRPEDVTWSPMVTPVPGGVMTGLVGSW